MTPSSTIRRPVRARTRRLAIAAAAASLGAAVALAGCSAGQLTQTGSQVPPVPGSNVDAGQVALRNLVIAYPGPQGYPAGGDAPLVIRVFNNGLTPITLVGVRADKAQSVTLVGTPEIVPTTEAPPPLATTSPPPSGIATPAPTTPTGGTSAPTTSAEPTTTPTAVPTTEAPSQPISITIPPQSYVLLVPGETSSGSTGFLRLNGLTEAITPGESTDVTFTFSDGTTTTVPVPLAPPTRQVPRATPVVPAAEHGEAE